MKVNKRVPERVFFSWGTVYRAYPGQPGPRCGCLLVGDECHAPTLIPAVAVSPGLICINCWDGQMELMSCVHSFCLDVASIDQLGVLGLSA